MGTKDLGSFGSDKPMAYETIWNDDRVKLKVSAGDGICFQMLLALTSLHLSIECGHNFVQFFFLAALFHPICYLWSIPLGTGKVINIIRKPFSSSTRKKEGFLVKSRIDLNYCLGKWSNRSSKTALFVPFQSKTKGKRSCSRDLLRVWRRRCGLNQRLQVVFQVQGELISKNAFLWPTFCK